jgi:hypothetical protein
MEGEEIFGSYKRKANLALGLEGDSHRHDCVNFAHPCVNHIIATSSVNIEEHVVDQIEEDVETLCGDGFWHIKRCPLCCMFYNLHCKKSTKHSCATRIIIKLTSIGVLTLSYLGLYFNSLMHL